MKTALIALSLLLVLAACSSKECKVDSDCTLKGACFLAVCTEQGVCQDLPKDNCCGNLKCEASENVCSCTQDCKLDFTATKKCEGKVQIENARRPGTYNDATYAEYYCTNNECVSGVSEKTIEQVQLLSTHGKDPKFEMISTISKPFELSGKGNLSVSITMTDQYSENIIKPITITRVQALYGNQLIGDQALNMRFTRVGDRGSATIPLAMDLELPEETRTIKIKVNYEYEQTVRDSTTTTRTSYEYQYSNWPFVQAGAVQ